MTNFHTTSSIRFLLTLSLIFTATTSYAAQPDSTQILKQMVESYGGESELVKLNSPYRQHWDMIAVQSNEKCSDQRIIDMPGKLTVNLTYPSKNETRILDGDEGRKIYDKTHNVVAHGPVLMAMKLQRMRLYNPLLLLKRAAEIKTTEVDDDYYQLTLKESGILTDYYVNRKTLLIDKVIGMLTMNGGVMTFLTEYDDYKPVDGIMMPHKEIKYAGNINTAVLTLRETIF